MVGPTCVCFYFLAGDGIDLKLKAIMLQCWAYCIADGQLASRLLDNFYSNTTQLEDVVNRFTYASINICFGGRPSRCHCRSGI